MAELLVRSIEAVTHGRFLISAAPVPGVRGAPRPLLVGFHGYGENAERHMEQLRLIPGVAPWIVASVQALHRFYSGRFEDVVASWMTRQDRELEIADNIAYVDRVMDAVRREHAVGRIAFLGFSQGVAMAFRAAVRGATRVDGVVALGGDVPPELRDVPAARFPRALLGRGTRDTWYTEDKLKADVALLESKGVRVEAVVCDAAHEWSDEFRAAAGRFLLTIL